MQQRKKPNYVFGMLMALAVAAQAGFWYQTKQIRPEMGVVPEVPGKEAVHALTFGDNQFFFRVLALNIQNAGDTFGRFTSLRYYDMSKLYLWFGLLDTLDRRSDMMPAMASYYFSQTQNTADVRYIVDYLYEHASKDVKHKWWWLLQSIYLASHKLEDMDLALKVAKPMYHEDVPAFAQQMLAVVHEKRGEMQDAYNIMIGIEQNAKHIEEADLKYMRHFIEERLNRLEELQQQNSNVP